MKKLGILLAGIIMLAGIVTGILKTMEIGPFAPTEEVEASAQPETTPEFTPNENAFYITMDPVIVPLFQESSVSGAININFKLEVLSRKSEELVQERIHRLKDAIFRDLYDYIPRTLHRNERLDVLLIKHRIVMISRRVLGEGVVNDAVIQSMTTENIKK